VTKKADDARPAAGDSAPRQAPLGGTTSRAHPKDPLHGITLQTVMEELHALYGWEELGRRIPIRCFTHEPSLGSSLTFLRRTPWARSQVEDLFLRAKREK
jgi:uncharacterized protein (DUF2132 family)